MPRPNWSGLLINYMTAELLPGWVDFAGYVLCLDRIEYPQLHRAIQHQSLVEVKSVLAELDAATRSIPPREGAWKFIDALKASDDGPGRWVTIDGTHVFIKDGESVGKAIQELHDRNEGQKDESHSREAVEHIDRVSTTINSLHENADKLRNEPTHAERLDAYSQQAYRKDYEGAKQHIQSLHQQKLEKNQPTKSDVESIKNLLNGHLGASSLSSETESALSSGSDHPVANVVRRLSEEVIGHLPELHLHTNEEGASPEVGGTIDLKQRLFTSRPQEKNGGTHYIVHDAQTGTNVSALSDSPELGQVLHHNPSGYRVTSVEHTESGRTVHLNARPNSVLGKDYESVIDGLSEHDKKVLKHYTLGVSSYKSGVMNHQLLNDHLRHGKSLPTLAAQQKYQDSWKHVGFKKDYQISAQEVAQKLPEILHRGVAQHSFKTFKGTDTSSLPKDLKVGDVFTDHGFNSSTTDEAVAGEFATDRANKSKSDRAIVEIHVPKGSKGLYLGDSSVGMYNEKEFLQHKATYKVTHIADETDSKGKKVRRVHLETIS